MLDYRGARNVYSGEVPMIKEAFEHERVAPYYEIFAPTAKPCGKAIIICPGGGYHNYGREEGLPVADYFCSQGYYAFILRYRFTPYRFPAGLLDLLEVIRTVRREADGYGIGKNSISVIGFSAGGHLALMAAEKYLDYAEEKDGSDCRPDRVILCYPAVTMLPPYMHEGSRVNLLGYVSDKVAATVSGEMCANGNCPPIFIWHSKKDDCVDCKCSVMLAEALEKAGASVRLELFDEGGHAMGMAIGTAVDWITPFTMWDKELDEKENNDD